MVLFLSVAVIGVDSDGFEGSDVALFCVKFVTLCLCYLGYSCGVGFKFTRPVRLRGKEFRKKKALIPFSLLLPCWDASASEAVWMSSYECSR